MKYFLKHSVTAGVGLMLLSGCAAVVQDVNKMMLQIEDNYLNDNSGKINHYKKLGNTFYAKGYYQNAVEMYEKANSFSKENKIYTDAYLEKLRLQGKEKGEQHYKDAIKVIKQDKMLAYSSLKLMMRNYPSDEGKSLYKKTKKDPEVEPFFSQIERDLQESLERFNGTTLSARSVHKSLNQVLKYDNTNDLIPKAQKLIKNQYSKLVESGVDLYFNKQYLMAKREFNLLATIYPEDEIITSYLKLISDKERFDNAIQLFEKEKYDEAESEFKYLLTVYKENRTILNYLEALKNKEQLKKQKYTPKKIVKEELVPQKKKPVTPKKEIAKKSKVEKKLFDTDAILKKAIDTYSAQNLDEAKKLFEEILKHEPSHKIAKAYIKKIEQQLNTLKSLQ